MDGGSQSHLSGYLQRGSRAGASGFEAPHRSELLVLQLSGVATMPRVKAAPTRRADDVNGDGAASANADNNDTESAATPTQASSGPARLTTLRVRHAGGMSRVEVDAARCTIANLKSMIADLDSVLADPVKMLLFKEGALSDPLSDGDTVGAAGLVHGSIIHMRLSKPRAPPTTTTTTATDGSSTAKRGRSDPSAAVDKSVAAHGANAVRRAVKKRKPTQLADGWSAEDVATNIIHAAGGGGGGSASGSSRQGGHAQRAADQFAQAHRVEAVDKGQLESSSNDRGEHSVMFTHHHRDAEVFVPLDTETLASVVDAVMRKVRTRSRDNVDTARRHLAVENLAGSDPAVFWSVWLVAREGHGGGTGAPSTDGSRSTGDGAADGGSGGGGTKGSGTATADGAADAGAATGGSGGGGGGSAKGMLVHMQALIDELIDKSLSQQHPSDMPLGLNV